MLIFLCCYITTSSGQAVTRVTQQERLLIVHSATDYYPYSYLDEHGRPVGFAVEMLDLVAQRMRLKIHRVLLSNNAGLEQFKKGNFDILQQYSRMREYDAYAEYTAPYLTTQGVLFVRQGEKRFESLEEARDQNLIVAGAPVGYDYARSIGIKPERLLRVSMQECLQLLSEGKVDAALLTRLTGVAQARQMGLKNIVVAGRPIKGYIVHFCLATHRGDSELLALLNDGVAQLIQSGEYEKLYDKWFAPFEPKRFTLVETVLLVAVALALALVIALWALVRQRTLRKRIARQAEELEESRSILADAQQLAKIGHWLRRKGENDIDSFAKEMLHIFGFSPEMEKIAASDLRRLIFAEDRQRLETAIAKLEGEGTPYEMDVGILLENGERKRIHIRSRPVKDNAGNVIAAFGTVQDITAWKAVEQALQQSEQLLRTLYENLPLALGVLERDKENSWFLISVNPAGVRLLGLQKEPTPGCSVVSLGLNHEAMEFWQGLLQRCIASKQAVRTDYTKHDTKRDYVITVVPIDRECRRVCYLMEDVTEHRRKDAEIAQSRRLRAVGELVGGIAHEFNNLLTPILLNSDLLQAEWAHEPSLCSELKVIADAARRSAALTRKLLAFGRKSERSAETISLKEVVAANIELVKHAFDRRIAIECEIPDQLPMLHMSGGDMHQILLNLLVNARDALSDKLSCPMDKDRKARIQIIVTTHEADAFRPAEAATNVVPESWIRLTVRDNGCGMPPSVIERIYEPFYTTKEVGRGTGLGLATIWHLVADYGGRVDVESAEGEGSTFHISLPAFPQAEPQVEHPNLAKKTADEIPSLKMLLVEDEEAISRLISALLRTQGHFITVATDGRIAWDMFSRAPDSFDAIIMDLNLPSMSGLEFARLVRANAYRGPILVISGRVSEEDRSELGRLGISGVLQKPFTGEEVRNAIAGLVTAQGNR